ncbi:MAG: prepilin-type N-terminal cleavage/methylation domain-containing protein [Deltaproteobacteria bacterium]|nr:prepilin-type N-terminal cleavage/methylation domain-containing protein [Deltaproteobacteria bacterium]
MNRLINIKKNKKQKTFKIVFDRSGFTLMETVITIGVFSILILSIFGFFAVFNKTYITENTRLWLLNDAGAAMEIISADIKMAGLDPLYTANAGFEEASASKIRITSDKNLNGKIDNDDFERVTYYFDPSEKTLKQILYEKTPSQSYQTLLEDITDLTFKFYGYNNIPTTEHTEIRSVLITFILQKQEGTGDNVARTLTCRSSLRN